MKKIKTIFITFVILMNSDVVRAKSSFCDGQLQVLEHQRETVLFYVWSPAMPLSIKGFVELVKAAKEDWRIIPLMSEDDGFDGIVRESSFPSILKNSPVQKSTILVNLGADLHFPTLFVMKEGRLLHTSYAGFKSSEIYQKFLAAVLQGGLV